MQIALAGGWVLPKIAIARVPQQLEAQTDPDPEKSPEYAPFKSLPADFAPADRERLASAGRQVIRDKVIPAFRSLKAFYEERYLPGARDGIGVSELPAGLPYYQALLAEATTTELTPREIHDLGMREVARIGARMDAIMRDTGFKGTRAEFRQFLVTDPRFFFTEPEAMLAGYRDIAKRADAELPKLFAQLPRQPYGIRAMRPEEGDNAEHYTLGAADGSRAGYFEANVNNLKTRPKWSMETLLLHEAVPGHHLQIARAQEIQDLPQFRRNLGFTAYSEGWALVCREPRRRNGLLQGPLPEIRQSFGRDAARLPAGRRHRHPRIRVDPRAGDRLHARQRGRDIGVHDGGGRPLHRLAGSGHRLQGRRVEDQGPARQSPGCAWRTVSISGVSTTW